MVFPNRMESTRCLHLVALVLCFLSVKMVKINAVSNFKMHKHDAPLIPAAGTCPKPPQNLLCLLGPRNTCTNDSNCEQGTLCCYDGCRRRCRNPSIFSGGAREGDVNALRKRICFGAFLFKYSFQCSYDIRISNFSDVTIDQSVGEIKLHSDSLYNPGQKCWDT